MVFIIRLCYNHFIGCLNHFHKRKVVSAVALTIVMDRDKLDMDLIRTADDSIPRVMRYINTCIPFVGLDNDKAEAICLVEAKPELHDIVIHAISHEGEGNGYEKEMLLYVLEYLRQNGVRWVEIGCGNACMESMELYQKVGFRFIGVWPDYYMGDSKIAVVKKSIINRDMVRMRADLNEKKLATTGYDASGRTK